MSIQTINPATGKNLAQYDEMQDAEINDFVNKSHEAFVHWREKSFSHRSQLMTGMANLLRQRKRELAVLIASEMGKPVTQGIGEIEKCAWLCEHYAENTESYLQPKLVKTELTKSMVCYQPLGVILAIMPWNFPFWQVYRCAVPALMAGNAIILKHAPITTGCGQEIYKLFADADFPGFLFQHAIADNDVAAGLIAHKLIRGLSFTGSDKAGRIVASRAAEHLKKTVLELGGNDPYLVLEDADIDLAAESIISSRLNNCGQVCIAAKRVIAHQAIYDELLARLQNLMKRYKMNSPLDEDANLGPMAREDLRNNIHEQVLMSIREGAKLMAGGEIPDGAGFYYPPTLLADVKPGMTAFEEELFGPVVVIVRAKSEKEAIQLANDSRFGLAGAVFTRDIERGEEIARNQLEVGTCCINTFVASDPRLPFGGIKNSGYGRELSREGLLEFVNIKTIGIR
ncbi:NAD-dependent succinate-semialdehyde dehydrogenase [Legionella spiritensis]|uniref:Succinate semialdehyde dehydrogenase n=1 Tax=Legionella spiritensis TaxID=452 RepID=A0A0W0Z497_LEGSP|nr:NAD-dependent succinate-semialdehyde dehydrogenase [Legionella spiritensis]KTD63938.1 succinate semialdehyde dehydrogenase [Legionella spiritensis]SNV36682.1 succinate semialdehyde dehydrogenase [Legionella spiritensis]